jgi:HD-GYP domain-containing protein (c-di-GMP phosphodiesterase class II)
MTTDRAYRQPRTPDQAVDELRRYSGIQFDDNVIEAFLRAYSVGSATPPPV